MLEPSCGTQKSWYPRVGTNQAPAHKRTHTHENIHENTQLTTTEHMADVRDQSNKVVAAAGKTPLAGATNSFGILRKGCDNVAVYAARAAHPEHRHIK